MTRRSPIFWLLAAGALVAALGVSLRPQAAVQAAAPGYADPASCAGCHAGIARTYARTGMARAFSRPAAASFPAPKPYRHAASDTWYEVAPKNGGWVQRWWQMGHRGERESAGEATIDYIMGSGNHVRTYLHRTARGTLIELPLAWYAEKGGFWALNPGFDTADPPVGRKIGYDCMFCHNAYPAIPAGHEETGAEPVFATPLPAGIDCQRCHGPGAAHVDTARRPGATAEAIRAAIVNPARLDPARSMDVCLQCHLETTVRMLPNSIRRYDRGPFSYRPGEPFSAFQLSFDHAPGSGHEEKFEIVNSVYRLRQSKCYIADPAKLGCSTCHNPHDIQHGAAAAAGYNRTCAGCHPAAQLAARPHPAGGDCVGCHMPKRRAEDVIHTVMTDHRIQRRPPPNPLAEFPERHGPQWEYRGEVVPYGDADPLYTAVAQVMHQTNLTAGIPRLAAEIARQKPARVEFEQELADALQRAGRSYEAADVYRAALAKRPDSPLLWARLAMPLRALGQTKPPLEAMRKSLELNPDQPEAWYNLGLLQSDLGDKAAAIAAFQKSISLDPELAESRVSLGAALAETGRGAEAESAFRAALSLRPSLPAAHAHLAFQLANRGELPEAVSHFERAGDGAANQLSLGITLARLNRLPEARRHLEKSLAADANQPVAHELLARLLDAAGDRATAVAHYREALRLFPAFGRARLGLGAALAGQGDREGAAAELRQAAADADPEVRRLAAAALAALGVR